MVTRVRGRKKESFRGEALSTRKEAPVSLKCATKAALISEMALPRFDRNKAVSRFWTRSRLEERHASKGSGEGGIVKPSGGGGGINYKRH